jgi:hypothetical protein
VECKVLTMASLHAFTALHVQYMVTIAGAEKRKTGAKRLVFPTASASQRRYNQFANLDLGNEYEAFNIGI